MKLLNYPILMRRILSLVIACVFFSPLWGQSLEENAIRQQLKQFENAHNSGNIDSMMMVVSNKYVETFLPDIVYDIHSFRKYYNSLINNREYRSVINYNIGKVEANGLTASSDVTWDYYIFPSRGGNDTLYYAQNKGTIQWEKEGESWKMKKTFAGNLIEENNLINNAKEQAIESTLLDWLSYYNNKELQNTMGLYDRKVKGISSFNGSLIFYDDLKREYTNLFQSENLRVKYELEGMQEFEYSEDLAYTILVWKYIVHDLKQNIINETRYRDLSVWKFTDSGHWKIVSFMRKEIE